MTIARRFKRKSIINLIIIFFIIASCLLEIVYVKFSSLMDFMIHIFIFAALLLILKYLVNQNTLLHVFERNIKITNLSFEQSPNLLVITNFAGQVEFANQRLLNFIGLTQESAKGKSLNELFFNPETSDITKLLMSIREGKEWQGCLKGYKPSKEPYWLQVNAFPIWQENDQTTTLVVGVDLTEQRLTEMALKESEVKYRTLFENATDAIYLYEIKDDGTPCNYIEVNEVACKRYGYSREEFLRITPLTLNSPESWPQIREIINSIPSGVGTTIAESVHVTKNGIRIPVEVNAHLFNLNNKKVVLANVRDISNRKRNEHALKESEKKYFDLFHNSPAVKIVFDPTNTKILNVNQAAVDFYGYSKEVLLNSDLSLINIASKETIRSNILKVIDAEESQTFNFVHRLANGQHRDVEVYACKTEINSRTLIHSITIDVTQRKLAEKALKISEEKYRTLFENANDAIFLYEVKDNLTPGNFIEVNTVACKRLGYTREELISMSIKDIDPLMTTNVFKDRLKILQEKGHITSEQTHVTKDGRKISVEISALQFKLNGKTVNLSIARDISERKRTEKLALLGELSTGVAHEIKNPLAIIRGYTEYIQSDEGMAQDSKDSLQYIINTVDRLDKVINNFLRFSQPVDFKLIPVDVEAIIIDTINFIKPTAAQKNIEIVAEFLPNRSKWYLDPDFLTQICLNLLLNSLEAMQQGKISITVFFDEVNHMNKIVVKDDGPGIKKGNQSKIFEPFFTTKKAGSGLGLSIVANLVRKMYGTIEVDSSEGYGTTFTISFPVK